MFYYLMDLLKTMAAGLPAYVFFRIFYLRWRSEQEKNLSPADIYKREYPREILLGIFVLFMVGLLMFVGIGIYTRIPDMLQTARERLHTGRGINLVPFRTITNYYRRYETHKDSFVVNVAGNVLMFVPWGFGLNFFWKKNHKFYRLLFFAIMFPVGIELMQLFIGRQVDIDDVILNFAGGMAGGLLYALLAKALPAVRKFAR